MLAEWEISGEHHLSGRTLTGISLADDITGAYRCWRPRRPTSQSRQTLRERLQTRIFGTLPTVGPVDVVRSVKPFRLGVLRGASQEFKPLATVGLASDGGLWVAPADVKGSSWTYGALTNQAPEQGAHVATALRPKLHYHRSGDVRITRTGTDLPLRSASYAPIPHLSRAQLLSVVTVRPWELNTDPRGHRQGDVIALEPKWPQRIAFSLSVAAIPEGANHAASLNGDGHPMGLLAGDPSRFVVEVTAHGIRALVICRIDVERDTGNDLESGTSVVAVPWQASHEGEVAESLGLWSSSMRNPMVWLESADNVLTAEEICEPRKGAIRVESLEDKIRDMQKRHWRVPLTR